jgi:hypothetical protein
MPTHYDTLGVDSSASSAEIRKAYLRRARALHPDRQLGRPPKEAKAAEEAMQQVNLAWSILSDPAKKSEYDKRAVPLRAKPSPPASQARPAPSAQRPPQRTPPPQQNPPRRTEPTSARIDEAEADGSVSIWASIPVLIIVGLALGVFVITAFADREPAEIREPAPTIQTALRVNDCFTLDGALLRQASCNTGTADGRIVSIVPDSANCPAGTLFSPDSTSNLFLCWERMIPGSINPVDGG